MKEPDPSTLCLCLTKFGMIFHPTGLPGGSDGKESACNAGDWCLTPRLGRSPGEGNGHPPQCSCLENPQGQRSLEGYSPWSRKEPDTTERRSLSAVHLPLPFEQEVSPAGASTTEQQIPPPSSFLPLLYINLITLPPRRKVSRSGSQLFISNCPDLGTATACMPSRFSRV